MIEPTSVSPIPERKSDDLSSNAHRQLLGYIGLILPGLLIVIVNLRDGQTLWEKLDSVSAYYYTGAVSVFVGMLVSMALFLFTYHGYENKWHWADRIAAIVAGIAALGVAIFPTEAPTGVSPLSWWQPWNRTVHYGSAVVLFLMFAIYAVFLFRLTSREDSEGRCDVIWHLLPPHKDLKKRVRDVVYLICGLTIIAMMVWVGWARWNDSSSSIFKQESIALIAFAISWIVKGRTLKTIDDAGRSLIRRLRANRTLKDRVEL